MKVMVVDDEPDIVYLVSMMLDLRGYEVVTAHSGSECLEKLQEEIPDLILLDLMMPVMGGWDVLDRIRVDERLKSIPVVILTAKQLTADVVHKKADYITEYLVKPITQEGLISVIEGIVSASRKLDSFVSAARDAGVDQETIDRYVQLDRETGTYKRLSASLDQIYTKKPIVDDAPAGNVLKSIRRLIGLRERDLAELHARISDAIDSGR